MICCTADHLVWNWGGGQLLSTDLLLEAQTPSAPRDGLSTPPLSRTHHNRALIGADVIHRVQNLNVRDTGDGSTEGIDDDLRRSEVDDAAVARIHCDHLVFGDVAANEYGRP